MAKLALVTLAGALAALAAAPRGARADDSESVRALADPAQPGARHFGVMVDAGAPEGGQVSLVIRPVRAIRLHGGAGYNGISTGLQGGIALIPFSSWFTPTLAADYGQFPEGDATALVQRFDPGETSPVLKRVGYHYENARVGLEFGRKRATFYIHAGVSRITGTVHDATAAIDDSSTVMVTASDPHVEAWTVSARVGLILYFGP